MMTFTEWTAWVYPYVFVGMVACLGGWMVGWVRGYLEAANAAGIVHTTEGEMSRWRHKKRGTIYEVVTISASLQCSTDPATEAKFADDHWTVYRSLDTGADHVRLTEEFMDGRFERVD